MRNRSDYPPLAGGAGCPHGRNERFADPSTLIGPHYASFPEAHASTGVSTCISGHPADTCTPGQPAPDDSVCNGIDDDCNGVADEDYVPLPTSCGVGACTRTGVT